MNENETTNSSKIVRVLDIRSREMGFFILKSAWMKCEIAFDEVQTSYQFRSEWTRSAEEGTRQLGLIGCMGQWTFFGCFIFEILRSAWMKKRYWGPEHPTPDLRLAWLYRIHGTVMVVVEPTQGPHTRNPYVGAGGRKGGGERRRGRGGGGGGRKNINSLFEHKTALSCLHLSFCTAEVDFTPTLQNTSFYWEWLSKLILPAQ